VVTHYTLHIITEESRSVTYPGIFFAGGCSTNSVEDRGQREWGSGDGSPLSGVLLNLQSSSSLSNFRDVKGCYGCIFHGTENSAQLCQIFGISGGGGFEPPKPPS
jgi:hypothetical protein